MGKTILAWHFLTADGRTGHGDTTPEPGGTETWDGALEMCRSGLHGCERLIDALAYAPGPLVRRVELSGEMIVGDDKIVARERRELWRLDATDVLREFACECAEDALAREVAAGRTPDDRSYAAITAARAYAATYAAWCAARDAAQAAAYAARDAAYAAWYAARDAAQAATYAARDAGRDAAYASERKNQNARLTEMAELAHKGDE